MHKREDEIIEHNKHNGSKNQAYHWWPEEETEEDDNWRLERTMGDGKKCVQLEK